ncbi:hypothetical protein [Longimicrobium sp.]|uniref:hypothetical protein n=1 Tax=Longimicrobium sp. TaxID=2029185 RepID=UPI002E35F795|nr:hypothetical protein [Longimicrobium sp.]HEX6040234.1 hypothetical protein [Longimicrobium sp.]
MEPEIAAALLSPVGGLLLYFVIHLLTFDWMTPIDRAITAAESHQLRGNQVHYRNCQRRRLGLRLSIMADVYGPEGGVYVILINRKGTILGIRRLNGWRALPRQGDGKGGARRTPARHRS